MAYSQEIIDKAIHLRKEERLSIPEIAIRVGVSKGTASIWLRDIPLGRKKRGAKKSEATKRKISASNKGKEISDRTKEKLRKAALGKKHSKETRKKMSETHKKRGWGGHTKKNSKRYKRKDGSTIFLQSSYEVSVAEELDRNNVEWIRPKPLTYGDGRSYYPDFYLPQYDVYLDPKNGYLIDVDSEKISQVQEENNVIVLILEWNCLTWDKIQEKINVRAATAGGVAADCKSVPLG